MKNKVLICICLLCSLSAVCQNIIPKPNGFEAREGCFVISQSTVISSGDFTELGQYLNAHISRGCRYSLVESNAEELNNSILFTKDSTLLEEAYRLEVSPERVELSASSPSGIYYALQSLMQLMPSEMYGASDRVFSTLSVPCVKIDDAPRYSYRGLMMDVSRTFFDKQTVMRHIDWMSRHKLNKLHWHLSDDNGWRVEIKSHPELTSRGAWRGPGEVLPASYGSGEQRYGGYYTQQDIREIVKYAQFRNVEIIPEIDLPGHSQVMTHVYPQTHCVSNISKPGLMGAICNVICVGREENYKMITDILTELAELFPSKYIHIGGDEVRTEYWRACSRCRRVMSTKELEYNQLLGYFINRVEKIAASLGKECGVWSDVLKSGTIASSTLVYGWETPKLCSDILAKGYKTVIMPASYAYLDMKQSIGERGHTWAGMVTTERVYSLEADDFAATTEQRRFVAGVEGAIFAELLGEPQRFIEYQLYPRLCAIAEVGWTNRELKSYDDFNARLTSSHFKRLAYMGIMFRLPPPKVEYSAERGVLISEEVEGADIYYSLNRNASMDNAIRYSAPIETTSPWDYNFRAYYHGGVSPIAKFENSQSITLKPAQSHTISFEMDQYVPFNAIWMMGVTPSFDNMMINRIDVSGADTTYTIIRTGMHANPLSALRLYVDDKHRDATLRVTLTNKNTIDNSVTVGFRPSLYIEPKVSVATSLEINSRFKLSYITDYNRMNYTRSSAPCKKGDYVTYTFAEPIFCSSINLRTGVPDLSRYIVTNGTVLVSSDGRTYTIYGKLDHNGAIVITPEDKIKSIRINIDGSNGEPIVALQDLFIIE